MATNNVFSDFQSQYKYRIAGVYNTSYYNLSRAIGNDDTNARLKSRLTSNTIQVNQIKNSGASADEISKKVGQTQLTYLRTASQSLYEVRTTTENLKETRAAIGNLTRDLENSINEYLKSTTRTPEEDAKFKENAEYIMRKMNSLYVTSKGRSAAAGNHFDINLYQANRRLDSMRALLANFPAANSSAPPAESATTGDVGGDDGSIEGTSSSTGQTLDVTA